MRHDAKSMINSAPQLLNEHSFESCQTFRASINFQRSPPEIFHITISEHDGLMSQHFSFLSFSPEKKGCEVICPSFHRQTKATRARRMTNEVSLKWCRCQSAKAFSLNEWERETMLKGRYTNHCCLLNYTITSVKITLANWQKKGSSVEKCTRRKCC